MTRREELTAWSVSVALSFLVFFFSLWLGRLSQLYLGAKSRIGEGKVIEIVLPPDEQEVRQVQAPRPKPAPQRVERQAPQAKKAPSPPAPQPQPKAVPAVPQERAIVESPPAPQPTATPQAGSEQKERGEAQARQEAPQPAGATEKKPQQEAPTSPPPPPRVSPPARTEEDLLLGYFARIKAIVERNKRYPEESRRRSEEGTVVVRVRISETGKIEKVELVKGSGYSNLDRETIRAVRAIGSFPPPPGGRPVEFNLEVEYRLGG